MAGIDGGVGGVDRRRACPLATDADLGAALPLAVHLLVTITGTYIYISNKLRMTEHL